MLHTRFIYTYVRLACLFACVACLTFSCNSEISDDFLSSKGAEMTFDVAKLSRASDSNGIEKFAVFGDMKLVEDDKFSTPTIVFNNKEVVYRDGEWCYEGIQYWFPKHEHSFVAVSPVSVLGPDGLPTYSDSKLSFTYAIPASEGGLSNRGDVADILISTHRRYYELGKTSDSRVSLTFDHLLSLINLAPAFYDNSMNSDAYILFHKLEFSGVSTKAKFDILPAPRLTNSQTDDRVVEVTEQETGNLTFELVTPVKVENNAENIRLFADNDAIIMLPRSFAAETEANVTLFYTINGDATIKQVVLPLSNLKWVSGSNYTYMFTIEKTGVKFNGCEINPWNVIEGDDITAD